MDWETPRRKRLLGNPLPKKETRPALTANRPRLTLAVLCRSLSDPAGGVKQYIMELTRALAETAGPERTVRAYLCNPAHRELLPGVETACMPSGSRLYWDHWLAPQRLRRDRPDVVLCPKNVVPLGLRLPALVTIHDLLYFPLRSMPGFKEYRLADVAYMRLMIPRSVRKARWVLADSDRTRRDVLDVFNPPEDRVSVVSLGVSPTFRQLDETQVGRTLERLGVVRPYVFYSGHLSSRKNVSALVRAMGLLKQRIPHQLVITGRGRTSEPGFAAALQRSGLGNRFIRLGLVKSQDLVALYNGADVFVYPSRYEGFGLPLLEAMACGCPVVTTTGGSLPEVAGDAALLCDPDDIETMAAHIESATTDPAVRGQLIDCGRRRTAEFTWQRTAQRVWECAEAVMTENQIKNHGIVDTE